MEIIIISITHRKWSAKILIKYQKCKAVESGNAESAKSP